MPKAAVFKGTVVKNGCVVRLGVEEGYTHTVNIWGVCFRSNCVVFGFSLVARM